MNYYIRASQLHMRSQRQYQHNSALPFEHTEMLSRCAGEMDCFLLDMVEQHECPA